MSPLGNRVFLCHRYSCYASVCVGHVFADAETAPLRENRPPRHLRHFPRGATDVAFGPPRRGGLRTPAKMAWVQPRHVPARQPAIRSPLHDHVMPRLASGPYLRTRRPRPSEKTAPDVISGLSPRGHSSSDHQSGGGAGSARPSSRLRFHPGISSLSHQTFVCP